MKLNDIYVAGLFDGEGWFEINRGDGKKWRMKREYGYSCRASLQMRDKHIIEGLVETYGGTCKEYKPRKTTHSTTYKWNVTGKKAKAFAERVVPHLLVKQEHANTLIVFQAEKEANGNRPLTEERYEKYGSLFQEMKSLNTKGNSHPQEIRQPSED